MAKFSTSGEAASAFEEDLYVIMRRFLDGETVDPNAMVGVWRALVSAAHKQELILQYMGLTKEDVEYERYLTLEVADSDAKEHIKTIPKRLKNCISKDTRS